MMHWREVFRDFGWTNVAVKNQGGCFEESLAIEELYQAFKARMQEEAESEDS